MADFRNLGKARAHFQERVSEGKMHLEAIDAAMAQITALEKKVAELTATKENTAATPLALAAILQGQAQTPVTLLSDIGGQAARIDWQPGGRLVITSRASTDKAALAGMLHKLTNEAAEGKRDYIILCAGDAATLQKPLAGLTEACPQGRILAFGEVTAKTVTATLKNALQPAAPAKAARNKPAQDVPGI